MRLRADGLLIKMYQKNCTTEENCAVKLIESDLNQEIKLAILKKAAQIKKGDLKKKNEERGEVIIPKNSKDIKKKKINLKFLNYNYKKWIDIILKALKKNGKNIGKKIIFCHKKRSKKKNFIV